MHIPMLPTLLAATSYMVAATAALSVRIQIPASNLIPNPNALPASTHATLTSAQGAATALRTPLRQGSYLLFEDIPATATQSFLLQIFSHNYVFAPYRLDVSAASQQQEPVITLAAESYPGVKWSDHGINLVSSSPTASLSLTAKVLGQKSFYETRQGFNVLNLLKNPMILMGLFALVFTFGMPKLIENMDPEMREEYEEMQRKSPITAVGRAMQGGATGSAPAGGADSFDLAGFLAGRSSGGATKTSGRTDAGAESVRERKR